MIDVAGVSHFAIHAQVSAKKRRGEFRYKLLGGIRLCTEAVLEITVEALLIATPVSKFMQGCCAIITIINEC